MQSLVQDTSLIAGGYYYDGLTHYYDDILKYDPEEDTITSVGHMTQARAGHAISVVSAKDYDKCNQEFAPVLERIIRTIRLFEQLGPNSGIRYSYSFIFWFPNTIRTIRIVRAEQLNSKNPIIRSKEENWIKIPLCKNFYLVWKIH